LTPVLPARRNRGEKPSQRELSVSSSRACEAISLVALVSSSRAQRGDLPVGIGFVIASAAWRSPCGHWFRHRERSVAISVVALVSSSRAQRGDLPVGIGFVIASAAWRSPCGLGGRLLLSLRLHRNDELYVIASLPFRHRERSVAISPWAWREIASVAGAPSQ